MDLTLNPGFVSGLFVGASILDLENTVYCRFRGKFESHAGGALQRVTLVLAKVTTNLSGTNLNSFSWPRSGAGHG